MLSELDASESAGGPVAISSGDALEFGDDASRGPSRSAAERPQLPRLPLPGLAGVSAARIGDELTLSYQLLEGRPLQDGGLRGHDGDPYGLQKAAIGATRKRGLQGGVADSPYMIIVLPDLLHTFESLGVLFGSLLERLPRGRVLLLSLIHI